MTGIYIHWPFCLSKCPYCDFNSHVARDIDRSQWLNAYITQIKYYAEKFSDLPVASVYFGGGTPSLMESYVVEEILSSIRKFFTLRDDAEITLEANPTSFERKKFTSFKNAGINRISIGIQALNDRDLKFLGRNHNADEAMEALIASNEIFEKTNFDLIYARPNQTLQGWEKELEQAMKYAKGHLSLYQLTIEPKTPFYNQFHNGVFDLPADLESKEFYELTGEITSKHGYQNYEISNYAMKNYESVHNMLYWRYRDYIGIGAGAHGRISEKDAKTGIITKYMVKDYTFPAKWLAEVEKTGNGIEYKKPLSDNDRAIEMMMMGLRMFEGISVSKISSECSSPWQNYIDENSIDKLCKAGFLDFDGETLKTTAEGKLMLNSILGQIIK